MIPRLGALLLLAAVLAGCAGPAVEPSPSPTAPAGPRTLRDLIAAPREYPVLDVDEATVSSGDGFRTALASYQSEGLRITGLLYLPDAPGPHAGVIVVHGSVDPGSFTTGSDLVREQETLARAGYVVLAPDLRGFAGSDPDPSGGTDLGVGATEDLVNAARALAASGIPQLDPERIALFGHSLGGGQSIGAMVVAPDLFDAVVAMSPVSTRTWWVIDHYVPRDSAEFAELAALHGSYEDDPAHWDDASPATFADRAAAPLLIAYGTADDGVYAVWEEHTVADWQTAGAPVELLAVEGGDHRLDPHWDEVWPRIQEFLAASLTPE
jgi:dipeptidyl aminopeptidase/acylaminoacyl peptidase